MRKVAADAGRAAFYLLLNRVLKLESEKAVQVHCSAYATRTTLDESQFVPLYMPIKINFVFKNVEKSMYYK